MTALPKQAMTFDEFLVWSEYQPGRHELVDGQVIVMQSERAGHARVKQRVVAALERALGKAGLGSTCEAMPDGMAVRINATTAFEPDALVYCGARLPADALVVPDPMIVVEVLSPSTALRDVSQKLRGYFTVPSIHHVVIVNPEALPVVLHSRQVDGSIMTRLVSSGDLDMTPPGINISVDHLFEHLA